MLDPITARGNPAIGNRPRIETINTRLGDHTPSQLLQAAGGGDLDNHSIAQLNIQLLKTSCDHDDGIFCHDSAESSPAETDDQQSRYTS